MSPIPFFIINYNLVEWPRKMVQKIRELGAKPIIVDNASTYEGTLDWYATKPCAVLTLTQNLGHRCVWEAEVVQHMNYLGFYGVTDPDLDISMLERNYIQQCCDVYLNYPWVTKVGASIEYTDLPDESPVKDDAIRWESRFWGDKVAGKNLYRAPIDTTFAVYHTNRGFTWLNRGAFCKAIRTGPPNTVRHLPFYVTKDNIRADFAHYILTATDPLATMPNYLRPLAEHYYEKNKLSPPIRQ